MALKKSQLYSSLWQSCDELRGGMDASQHKDYVLTLLFMKYVSDKHESDRDALIEVPEGGGFADMVELKGNKEIGDRIDKIIGKLAEANDLKGVIDQADFNDESKLGSGKAMQDRLSKPVGIFEDLDFSANRAGGDDLLGDAYEYLMMHFATESGKSKGQFYTPAEVSRIIAKVVGVGSDTRQDQTIYDPTCGSGSLLLKAVDEAPNGISVYGQEMDNATWSLARMNLILHGQETAEIWRDNTLSDPYFRNENGSLKTHDFAVANPPFSFKSWSTGFDPDNDEFNRFEYGVPPAKNGDYAFLLHLATSLKSRGKGAIILPHGVLFRGNREAEIRRNLIGRGLIKGIIVIDKEGAPLRDGVFMIDASRGFIKDGNKNRLRGGIPNRDIDALGEYWSVFPSIRKALFEDCGREGYSKARISIQEVKTAIPDHEEFREFSDQVWNVFNNWREIYRDRLCRIHSGTVPKFLIAELSEEILSEFADLPLIDPYDIYQRLMDYWQETMQDDVYLIVGEGWRDAAKPRGIVEDKRRKLKETPDLIVKRRKYKFDLIPPELVVNRYYAEESTEIESLRTKCDAASRELEEFAEEHTGEDGLLEEALNDKGKLTKASATARFRAVRAEPDGEEEQKLLDKCLTLLAAEADAAKAAKDAQAVLDALVLERYAYLSDAEIKSLVVEDKWLATIQAAIEFELRNVAQRLAARIAQIEERYAKPLPDLERDVEIYSRKVERHLEKMGIAL